jgi:hypothetical protein
MRTLSATPRPLYHWKAEDLSFLHVLLVLGIKLGILLNKSVKVQVVFHLCKYLVHCKFTNKEIQLNINFTDNNISPCSRRIPSLKKKIGAIKAGNFIMWPSLTIGAVLIKNYASLDKNENKFQVFFLKIATYQSTPKILYVLKGLKGT